MDDLIKATILKYTGPKDGVVGVFKLYGDASYRTYFRARLSSGRTFIVMKMPVGAASVSEEITNYEGPREELPYINISNYLRSLKLPVPEILFYDKGAEALILEDVGDNLFLGEVSGADDEEKFLRYKGAIELLVLLKEKVAPCRGSVAFKRSFGETLLNWEFDHFMEYGVEARFQQKIPPAIREQFNDITRAISKEIVKMNYVFTHRDFQSRNLIIKDSKIYMLDFQDALMGPESYDLVALTRDSYVDISDDLLERLISCYCDLRGLKMNDFRRDFDLVTIQRKLKDAGRFVYIDRVKKNPDYLVHIPRSLDYVRKALKRRGEYRGLFDLLKPFVPEWKDG